MESAKKKRGRIGGKHFCRETAPPLRKGPHLPPSRKLANGSFFAATAYLVYPSEAFCSQNCLERVRAPSVRQHRRLSNPAAAAAAGSTGSTSTTSGFSSGHILGNHRPCWSLDLQPLLHYVYRNEHHAAAQGRFEPVARCPALPVRRRRNRG